MQFTKIKQINKRSIKGNRPPHPPPCNQKSSASPPCTLSFAQILHMTNPQLSKQTHIFGNGPLLQNLHFPAGPLPCIPFLGFNLCSWIVNSPSGPSFLIAVFRKIVPGILAISDLSSSVSATGCGTPGVSVFGVAGTTGGEYAGGGGFDGLEDDRVCTDFQREKDEPPEG